MIILFILFLIQFSIASSCLAIGPEEQKQFAEDGWTNGSNEMRKKVQDSFLCCGYNSTSAVDPNSHPSCEIINVRNCFNLLNKILISIQHVLICVAKMLPARIFIGLLLHTMFTKTRGNNKLYF